MWCGKDTWLILVVYKNRRAFLEANKRKGKGRRGRTWLWLIVFLKCVIGSRRREQSTWKMEMGWNYYVKRGLLNFPPVSKMDKSSSFLVSIPDTFFSQFRNDVFVLVALLYKKKSVWVHSSSARVCVSLCSCSRSRSCSCCISHNFESLTVLHVVEDDACTRSIALHLNSNSTSDTFFFS